MHWKYMYEFVKRETDQKCISKRIWNVFLFRMGSDSDTNIVVLALHTSTLDF